MNQEADKSDFKISLDDSGSFTVGASKKINFLFGGLFLLMVFAVIASTDFNFQQFSLIYIFLLIPPVIFFKNAVSEKKVIIINTTGIYHRTKFITGWPNFKNAYIRQLPNEVTNSSDGLTDRYRIAIVYLDDQSNGGFVYNIPLSGTQDKSEYEIIDAIIYFSGKQLTYDIYD